MPSKNKLMIAFVTAVVIIVLILLALGLLGTKKTSQQPQNQQAIGQPQPAPKGQLAAGFPTQLAQPAGVTASTIDSYSIPYNGQAQYTANLSSSQSLAAVVKGYTDYFNANQFIGVKQSKVNTQATIILAQKGGATYTVAVQQLSAKAQTTITVTVLKNT